MEGKARNDEERRLGETPEQTALTLFTISIAGSGAREESRAGGDCGLTNWKWYITNSHHWIQNRP